MANGHVLVTCSWHVTAGCPPGTALWYERGVEARLSVLQNMIRWFLPQEDRFFDYLDGAVVAADAGALLFRDLAAARDRDAQLALVDRIQDAEHDGDQAMRDMADAL